MKKDAENILIDFSNEATKLFGKIYEQYESASSKLDRRRDENVFRQLTAQYVHTLKQQLEEIALGLIDQYRVAGVTQLQQLLTERIAYYLNEFNRRSGIL